MKEELILTSSASQSTFRYSIALSSGLSAQENAIGGVDFVDAEQQLILSFDPPFVHDSANDLRSSIGPAQLRVIQSSPETVIELAADRTWLDSPDRIFPVVVEPTVTFSFAGQDTYIANGRGADLNFASSSRLFVGEDIDGTRGRSLVQFPIESEIIGQVAVQSARVDLFLNTDSSPRNETVGIFPLVEPWTGPATTWNRRTMSDLWLKPGGTFDTSRFIPTDVQQSKTVASWQPFYITSLAQSWLDRTTANNGLILLADGASLMAFDSNEAPSGKWPRLTVHYERRGNGDSLGPSISENGQFIAFSSRASNLVGSDINGVEDVFVRDMATGKTKRVSVSSAGLAGNQASSQPSYLQMGATLPSSRTLPIWCQAIQTVALLTTMWVTRRPSRPVVRAAA
ncbi:MAG TPA: DNRLRE domain-containing protein [Acidimicrobiales bacterium]|nr:DNRLRE domain-containing protein [Acidimicrobiales bacterium]